MRNHETVWSVVWLNAKDRPFFGPGMCFWDGHDRPNAEALARHYRQMPGVERVVIVKTERRRELFDSLMNQLEHEASV
jgi:hypothetical protein